MWTLVSLLAIATSLALVLRMIRPFAGDRLSQAVVLLIWARFALTALGEPAQRPVIAGQSLLALGTLIAVVTVIMVVPLATLRQTRVMPFAAMAFLVLLSAILNGQAGAIADTVILWMMFFAIAVLTHRALQHHGSRAVLGSLLAAFSLPIGLQLAGFLLGQSQIGQDGTIGYIGNYVHEAVFATVALCAVWLVIMYPWQRRSHLVLAFTVMMVSMFLANYRTLILACLPLLIVLVTRLTAGTRQMHRPVIPLLAGVALALVAFTLLPSERFAEMGTAIGQLGDLAKPAQEFTAADKNLLSARLYIGTAFFEEYVQADLLRHLIGFGPAADTSFVGTHPHNEFLRILFEYGLAGLLLWLGIIARLVAAALQRAPRPANAALASGYGALVIGGLGTSFFIRPEGIIFVSLLVAVTWHLTAPQRRPRHRSREYGVIPR